MLTELLNEHYIPTGIIHFQYIWDNNNVYSGFWLNGKQDGTGLWFKNSDYSMWIVEYDNGTFINSEELGFSPEEEDKVNQQSFRPASFDEFIGQNDIINNY